MRRLLLAATAAILLAACGKTLTTTHTVTVPATLTPTCTPTVPARMGECVQRRYGLTPKTSRPASGWDISVYQGTPLFPSSLRFAYNQVGDGASYRDPNFSTNCARERARGIRCGAYLFVRPGNAYGQALVLASVLSRTNLPPALDLEVPGSYQELCPIAQDLKADFHVSIVVAYTAPGLWWGGSACGTRLWAAEWGTSGYAFSGWGSYVVQQTCGTCVVDEDSDHGLLALVKPKPTPAQKRAQAKAALYRAYRRRNALRADLTRRRCRTVPLHAVPHRYQRLCGRWLTEGANVNRTIRADHRAHVY